MKGGISDPRNPYLALMTGLIGMAERAGNGVSDVVSLCRNNGMSDPNYTETTEPETVTAMLKSNPLVGSEDVEGSIIWLIKRDPTVTLDQISKETDVERNKVDRIVKSMKDKGANPTYRRNTRTLDGLSMTFDRAESGFSRA